MSESHEDQEGHPDDDTIVIRTTPQKLKEAERQLLEIQNLNAVPAALGKYSLRACIFQFSQAAVLWYLASQSSSVWYLFTNYPEPEDDALSNPATRPEPEEIAGFSILWYSPIFLTLSGIQHFCCLYFRSTYIYYIARNQNPFRWTEYSISAPLMRVMIAQLAGITDIHLLLCILVLTVLTIQLGSAHEVFNAKARADGHLQNRRCIYLAVVSQLVCWGIIFNYFAVRVSGGTEPDFIWVIVIIMFLLDCSFAVTFNLQWVKIPPFDGTSCRQKKAFPFLFLYQSLTLVVM
jgi:Heliorhodopsin